MDMTANPRSTNLLNWFLHGGPNRKTYFWIPEAPKRVVRTTPGLGDSQPEAASLNSEASSQDLNPCA